uniref:Carboxylesterase type B domain-containing protein n=1 Tax=Oryzias latipes TaxID=8090 RepID=A0A3P9LJQ5_ORYLA
KGLYHYPVSEDCLYLNIFVPRSVDFSEPVRRPLPVMVWIHGGDFIAGSASKPIYDGRFISNFTNTVVVNLEYRLGKKVFYSNTHLFCFNMKFFSYFEKINPFICIKNRDVASVKTTIF